jgi:SAM-dependent methyltransferase
MRSSGVTGMGIPSSCAFFLMRQAKARPFCGSILTLGVQSVGFDAAKLLATSERAQFKLPGEIPSGPGLLTDIALFRALGFNEIVRTDVNPFEGAEFIFDLNSSEPPPDEYRGRFDVVFDGGTMEHVFHVPNVLKNIFYFLKSGGRVIHVNPSSNHIDHGFYMFSPTLHYDYYSTNEYQIDSCKLIRYTLRAEIDPWEVGDYTPGALDQLMTGGLDAGIYGIAFAATKTHQSTHNRIPTQSFYAKRYQPWQLSHNLSGSPAAIAIPPIPIRALRKARRLLRKSWLLLQWPSRVLGRFVKRRPGPFPIKPKETW